MLKIPKIVIKIFKNKMKFMFKMNKKKLLRIKRTNTFKKILILLKPNLKIKIFKIKKILKIKMIKNQLMKIKKRNR